MTVPSLASSCAFYLKLVNYHSNVRPASTTFHSSFNACVAEAGFGPREHRAIAEELEDIFFPAGSAVEPKASALF